ncbi:hypothetical protein [Rhodococcus koreensis]|uniref:hypothetical protein n=1 Tax=Rhodococcus koreensis TaxID=99653 RepID=UPI001F127744|nr:hypothetical protein [Rhodococcus koreensis]
MTMPARDRRVAAVVAQVPYVDGLATLPRSGWSGVGTRWSRTRVPAYPRTRVPA